MRMFTLATYGGRHYESARMMIDLPQCFAKFGGGALHQSSEGTPERVSQTRNNRLSVKVSPISVSKPGEKELLNKVL